MDYRESPMALKFLTALAREAATSRHEAMVLARFVLVGFSFTLAYSALSSLLALGARLTPPLASAIGYAICVPFAYLSHRNLAFRANSPHAVAFPRYVALQAPLLLLGAGLSWFAIRRLMLPEPIGFFLVGVTVAAVSFAAQRLWTFAEKKAD